MCYTVDPIIRPLIIRLNYFWCRYLMDPTVHKCLSPFEPNLSSFLDRKARVASLIALFEILDPNISIVI